ncbi:ATP-dependent protease LonB [Candidatus Woesearchaeota archaeon]|nr:ATP-dependent protease LonB [Candidatus Woesearchaeota archaeon]
MNEFKFKTTKEINVPKLIIDQIIGQDKAVQLLKKIAKQRRNLLLIGSPGVGKSLIAQALAELLSKENLQDIVAFKNPDDENVPLIKTYPKGQAAKLLAKKKIQSISSFKSQSFIFIIVAVIAIISPWWIRKEYGDIMAAASLISSMIFLGLMVIFINLGKRMNFNQSADTPKILVNNSKVDKAPFIDGSGAHSGALFGDVLHDPLQSGGLGTPPHERLIPGMIHRANKGVLFIDEIANLKPQSQQDMLTVLQEKKFPITGQSERSSGAMTRSEPVPADFILVASGNPETLKNMHPALRSRIRGYGYEVYVDSEMDDSKENRLKLVRYIAQEVQKDKKIPHFTREAAIQIINEAKKRAGRAGKLTLRLRELGGLIRAAGDIALDEKASQVEPKHIEKAKQLVRTLEQQIADKYIDQKKEYQVITTTGKLIGKVNGLAVLGSDSYYSGIVLPIESEVTFGGKKTDFIATGQLGKIALEAVKNVSAIVMKYFGEDIKEKYDIFVQFIQTTDSGVEGDSASIAVATAIISALKKIPIKQNFAMTGSLSVRGEVLAIGGVTSKIEAAIEAGIENVIIPKSNLKDVLLSKEDEKKVNIIPVETIEEVLKSVLDWSKHKELLKKLDKPN